MKNSALSKFEGAGPKPGIAVEAINRTYERARETNDDPDPHVARAVDLAHLMEWYTESPVEDTFLWGVAPLLLDRELHVVPQAEVGPFRVDFLLWHDAMRDRTIAVEIDGHDFHDRTKEQASHDRQRDRRFFEAGFTPIRFTGSDVWADPFRCAEEAVRIARGES